MPREPVVSLELAKALQAAGAPQQAGAWWWEESIAAYTIWEILEHLCREPITLEWHYTPEKGWVIEVMRPYHAEASETAVEALGRIWLWQLQAREG